MEPTNVETLGSNGDGTLTYEQLQIEYTYIILQLRVTNCVHWIMDSIQVVKNRIQFMKPTYYLSIFQKMHYVYTVHIVMCPISIGKMLFGPYLYHIIIHVGI